MDYNNIPAIELRKEYENLGTEFVIEDGKISSPKEKVKGNENV